jgi:hypothetical protein
MAKQKITPNQVAINPMVSAQRPNGAGATVTGPAILIFTSATLNVGGGYSTGTGRFTAPKAGKYFVNFTGFKNNDASSGQLDIRKNGTSQCRQYLSGTLYLPVGITYIVDCAVNDLIDIYIGSGLIMHGNEAGQLVIMYVGE